MTSVNFPVEMSVFISISTGGEAEAQVVKKGLTLPFHRKRSAAVLESESSLSMSWSTALPAFGRRAVCCCCSSHALLVPADLLHFILPALNFLFDFRCFLFCCSARRFSPWRKVFSLSFLAPEISLMLLIIQTLFWFIKCPARVTEVFWGPCLSRDVPLCRCHTNAESHRRGGSDQVQVTAVSLELLQFEILSHVFLLPWMLTLEGLGLGSVKNCLGLEPGLPALEESVAQSIWPKCPAGEKFELWNLSMLPSEDCSS